MSTGEVGPLPARRARWLVGGAFVSLVAAAWLLLTPGRAPESVGADGYSRSAIGHRGLLQLLQRLGEPVVQQRSRRVHGPCGVLVFAEPQTPSPDEDGEIAAMAEAAGNVLLVLPKRTGERDARERAWLGEDAEVAEDTVAHVLREMCDRLDEAPPNVLRIDAVTGWNRDPAPELMGPAQLLDPADVDEALIACDQGVLLGRIGLVHVLADPDLIANHGLGRGDNAAIAVQILRDLRGSRGIVFDETLHGMAREPSIFHELGKFPLVLVPVHLLLLAALLLWLANGRFGPVAAPPVAIGAGKRFLIDNIASLLHTGRRTGPSLRQYGALQVRRAAERQHVPPGLDDAACRAWLLLRIRDPERRAELERLLAGDRELPPREATAAARRIRQLSYEVSHVGK